MIAFNFCEYQVSKRFASIFKAMDLFWTRFFFPVRYSGLICSKIWAFCAIFSLLILVRATTKSSVRKKPQTPQSLNSFFRISGIPSTFLGSQFQKKIQWTLKKNSPTQNKTKFHKNSKKYIEQPSATPTAQKQCSVVK
jgi:hypothetical protein